MSIRISSFVSTEPAKDLFLNKFTNMEQFYRKQDEKKSIFSPEIPHLPKNSLKIDDNLPNKNHLSTPRKSRQSIMFASPRKSLMFESKTEMFASSSAEKARNLLKTVDFNKFSQDQLLDVR